MYENIKPSDEQSQKYSYTEIVTNTVFEIISSIVVIVVLYIILQTIIEWKFDKNDPSTQNQLDVEKCVKVAKDTSLKFVLFLLIFKLSMIFRKYIHEYYPNDKSDKNNKNKFIAYLVIYFSILIGLSFVIIIPFFNNIKYHTKSYVPEDYMFYYWTLEGFIVLITIIVCIVIMINTIYKIIHYVKQNKFIYSKTISETKFNKSLIIALEHIEEHLLLSIMMLLLLMYALSIMLQTF